MFSASPGVALCLYHSKDISRHYLLGGWARQGEALGVKIFTKKNAIRGRSRGSPRWLVIVGDHYWYLST